MNSISPNAPVVSTVTLFSSDLVQHLVNQDYQTLDFLMPHGGFFDSRVNSILLFPEAITGDKMFVDLSHTFEDGMPGFVMKQDDGTVAPFTASIKPFLTHDQSKPYYNGLASFELTEVAFTTSIGTYLDSPMHRFEGMRDISELKLEEVVLDAVVIRVAQGRAEEPISLSDCDIPEDIAGKAVLFQFGWDKHWGTDLYETYPFIGEDVIARLVEGRAKLVGMDTFNADDRTNPKRPCHSELLKRDILIVENLRNLEALPDSGFRFFAVPIKAKSAAAMTIRAFAEITE